MELNVEKYGYAQMGAMAINGFCAPLAHGIYTVTAFMVHKGGASHKLGDMRVTTHQELRPKPEVVAYLWAGDRVTLFEHDTTPTRLHTGELRIFIHLLINNWPRPQYGWITYSPVPNTTWLCLEQHLMLHTTAPIDPYYASTLPPPLLVALPFTSAAVDTSTLSAVASTAGYHPEGAEALYPTDDEATFLMVAPVSALHPPSLPPPPPVTYLTPLDTSLPCATASTAGLFPNAEALYSTDAEALLLLDASPCTTPTPSTHTIHNRPPRKHPGTPRNAHPFQ